MGWRTRRLAPVVVSAVGAVLLAACDGPDDRAGTAERPRTIAPDTVVRVDAGSGRVQAVIPVGANPGLIATASGQVWTLNGGDATLSRIDPAAERATEVNVGDPAGFTSAGDALWVANEGNRLVRLDGATGAAEAEFRLAGRELFARYDAGFLVAAAGSLWLTVPELGEPTAPQTLWRVDPATGAVQQKLPIGVNPLPPLAAGKQLWLITRPERRPGELSRIDLASGQRTELEVGPYPWALATGAGSVWVGHFTPQEVWRLDPATANPSAKIPVDEEVRGIAYGGGFVWVITATRLLRIDPASNAITRRVSLMQAGLTHGPFVITYLEPSLWIAVTENR